MITKAYYHLGKLAAQIQARRPFGRSIFDDDWDVCIVLDSARLDMLQTAWQREEPVEGVWSRGSITTEWLANTFREHRRAAIADTAYATASPHSTTVFDSYNWLTNHDKVDISYPWMPVVSAAAFDGFHEVWRTHATDHDAVPPDVMLDATLEAADRYDRVVAHWLQPHEPFIAPGAPELGGGPTEQNVWTALNNGDADSDAMWQSYRLNLEYALARVEVALENLDGTVLVTADHGNAYGEWGIYGHPFAWPQPAVRKVPWVTVDATDHGTYAYDGVLETGARAGAVDDQLAALGYR